MKYIRVIHPSRVLPAGAAAGVRGQAAMLLQENPDRVGLWIFPRDNDIVLLSELDQGSPGFLLKGGALNIGIANVQFGDVPICDQGRLYAASVSNVTATVDVMELVREGGGLGASPP